MEKLDLGQMKNTLNEYDNFIDKIKWVRYTQKYDIENALAAITGDNERNMIDSTYRDFVFSADGLMGKTNSKARKMQECLELYLPKFQELKYKHNYYPTILTSGSTCDSLLGEAVNEVGVMGCDVNTSNSLVQNFRDLNGSINNVTICLKSVMDTYDEILGTSDFATERSQINKANAQALNIDLLAGEVEYDNELFANLRKNFLCEMGFYANDDFLRKFAKDNKAKMEELEEIRTYEKMYGFTYDEAKLLIDTIKLLEGECENKTREETINYVYGTLTALCISYDAKRWRWTTGQPTSEKAMKRLKNLGMTDDEINDLRVIINLQHADFTYAKLLKSGIDVENSSFASETNGKIQSRATDACNDYAHTIIQLAAFSNNNRIDGKNTNIDIFRYGVDLFNSQDLEHSYTNYEISFKGDIDSGRYSEADFQSDVDGINIYNRMLNDSNSKLNDVYSNYYSDVNSGKTNRAAEFFANLGDGNEGDGILELDKILQKETYGSTYIQQGNGMTEDDIDKANSTFVQWIMCEYKDLEYDFPE